MGLRYDNLDDSTREYMLAELERDLEQDNLYLSVRLSPDGIQDWPEMLKTALAEGTDESLAAEIAKPGRLNPHDIRQGRPIQMNKMAHLTLGEGEFNRFYIRGVCRRAIDEGRQVVAYRARFSSEPRSSSLAVDGKEFDPALLLEDLRAHPGTEPQHGFPGPNSGMSIRLA
jgi:hypothetical protein